MPVYKGGDALTVAIREHLDQPRTPSQIVDLIGGAILQRSMRYRQPITAVRYQLKKMVYAGQVIQDGWYYVRADAVAEAPLPPKPINVLIADHVEQYPGRRKQIRDALITLVPDFTDHRLDSWIDRLKGMGVLAREPDTGIFFVDSEAGRIARDNLPD